MAKEKDLTEEEEREVEEIFKQYLQLMGESPIDLAKIVALKKKLKRVQLTAFYILVDKEIERCLREANEKLA